MDDADSVETIINERFYRRPELFYSSDKLVQSYGVAASRILSNKTPTLRVQLNKRAMNPRRIHALLLLAFGLVCSAAGQPGSIPPSSSAPPTTASDASTGAAPADIFDAVAHSDLSGIAALLSAKPQLSFATNSDGQTPLHVAAFDGGIRRTILGVPIPKPKCLDMARLLVASKADVNARDNSGQTPLHRAAFCGRADVMAFLLANKATSTRRTLMALPRCIWRRDLSAKNPLRIRRISWK